MPAMKTIKIDIDVYRVIESRRKDFSQSPNAILRDILREVFHLPTAEQVHSEPSPALQGRRTGEFGFTLRGVRFEERSLKSAYMRCLREIATLNQEFLEELSQITTRSRRIVAQDPEALYRNRRSDLAEKFAEPLIGSWWVDTNLSRSQCEQRLRRACEVARFQFGEDLVLDFR